MDNILTGKIIECAINVHRELGPGLLESTYEQCLSFELTENNIEYKTQMALPVIYRGNKIECGYRIDMFVEDIVIVELKSVVSLEPIHTAQLLTYMKLSNIKVGLLINFNVKLLKNGIKRVIL
jgi:GxxExxY protein